MDAVILPRLRFPRARGQQPPPVAREGGRSDAETGLAREPWSPGACDTRSSRPEGTQAPGAVPAPPFPGSPRPLRATGGRAHRSGRHRYSQRWRPRFPPAPRPPPTCPRPTCVYSAATAMSEGAWAARGRDGATRGAGPAARGPREVAVRGAASAALGRPAAEVSCGSTNFPEGCGRGGRRDWSLRPTPRRDWPGRGRGRARPSSRECLRGQRPSKNRAERARCPARREQVCPRLSRHRLQLPEVAACLLSRAEGHDHFHRKPKRINKLVRAQPGDHIQNKI